MTRWELKHRLPGYVATGLMVVATSLWVFWGVGEMFYEGWWDAWYYRVPYFVPGAVCLGLTLIALRWPRLGGGLVIIVAGFFTVWWWWHVQATIGLTLGELLVMLPVSGLVVLAGALFVVEGYYRRRTHPDSEVLLPSPKWLHRNLLYILATVFPLLAIVAASVVIPLSESNEVTDGGEIAGYSDSDRFRDLTVQFVRTVAEDYFDKQQTQYPEELEIRGNWRLAITIYHQGEIKGNGNGNGRNEVLALTLAKATQDALEEGSQNLNEEDLKDVRFLVTFSHFPVFFGHLNELLSSLPYFDNRFGLSFSDYGRSFSFIEYNGTGKELIEDLVIIRSLDKELILQKIEQGKEFLFRAMHEDEHGFYKKYEAINDDFGNRLHTVYSASIIYTLLKIYDFDQDEGILDGILDWGDFLISMQSRDVATYGAFHYSYYFETKEKEPRFVVGTTALSIFTLLDLYQRTGDAKYLESAKTGGNWLITMQRPDGSMKEHKRYRDGKWFYGTKESLLYNGQVLSALSRLYIITGEERYYDTAEGIAQRFAEKVEEEGYYLGDDYRWENPISTAWIVMSLLDFHKTNQDEQYKEIIFRCGDELLARQETDVNHPLYYGSWHRAYSTSGNGWLAEVMLEMYRFSREQNVEGSERYKEAVIKVILWIIQNTYSEENTFFLKEPQKAIGGIFMDYSHRYVRTDSMSHALNAYIGIINDLEDGLLFSIPEKPFEAVLNNLRN
jgi:rhamnogalacturonyl hydrolase YesR